MRCRSVERILLRLQLWQLSPADVSRDVRSESRYPSSRWSVNGDKALIADEMSRFGVVDIRQKLAAAAIKLLSQHGSLDTASALFIWEGIFPILQEDDLLWLLDLLRHCSGNQFTVAGSIFVTGFRWFGLSFFANHSEAIYQGIQRGTGNQSAST